MPKRICSIDACEKPVRCLDLCEPHYRRQRKFGSALAGRPYFARVMGTVEQRFWAKVEKSDGCWLWTGALREGYGRFCIGNHVVRQAHRVAWEWANGPVPDELYLDHLCRTPRCVRPDHLEPVTNGTNVLRGVGPSATNATKTHCNHGHAFTPANTWVSKEGDRHCRACRAARARDRRLRERRAS